MVNLALEAQAGWGLSRHAAILARRARSGQVGKATTFQGFSLTPGTRAQELDGLQQCTQWPINAKACAIALCNWLLSRGSLRIGHRLQVRPSELTCIPSPSWPSHFWMS